MLALVVLASPTSASAYIYWANISSSPSIGRANLNGTGVNQRFITGANTPEGVAVDGSHLYWANSAGNSIGRANLNGTGVNQNFIVGAQRPTGVAVDSDHIYWTNEAVGAIGRANITGTGINQSFITGDLDPWSVAVDRAHVYWTNDAPTASSVGRADLNGANPNQNFITGTDYPGGLAVDANHIWWTNGGTNSIGRANLDGGGPNYDFIGDASDSYGLAVDAGHVYWGNYGSGTTLGRSTLSASLIQPFFITGANSPSGVAVDNLSPPPLPILGKPAIDAAKRTAHFSFRSGGGSTRGFQCALVPTSTTPHFSACSSPKAYMRLKRGSYTFEARAASIGGPGLPARKRFKI